MTSQPVQKCPARERRGVHGVVAAAAEELDKLDVDEGVGSEPLETGVGDGEIDIGRFGDVVVAVTAVQRVVTRTTG